MDHGPIEGHFVRLITCIGVDHDLPLLPHFVDHYRALGIRGGDMTVIVNTANSQSPRLEQARHYLKTEGLRCEEWIAPYTSDTMWEKRREVQIDQCSDDGWVLSADIDEFHRYPEPLPAFLLRCERLGVNVVQGVFVDRLRGDGRLVNVDRNRPLTDQFPTSAAVMGKVANAGRYHSRHSTVKVMAVRNGILPARGGHDPLPDPRISWLYRASLGQFTAIDDPDYRFAVPTRVDHYHWTDALRGSLEQRLATPGVSDAGREYGGRQLDYLGRHDGIAARDIVADQGPFPRPDWATTMRRLRLKGAAMNLAYRARRMLSP